ncbi:class I SAM-dependent methyltransferase [Actinokineospora sp. 24-640]
MTPWGPVGELVLAVGGRDEQLLAAVDGIGLKQTAEVVVAELLLRCEPPSGLPDGFAIGFELTHREDTVAHVFRFGDGACAAEPGWADGLCTLSFAVEDILRALYGPPLDRPPVSRTLRVEKVAGGFAGVQAISRATAALLAAASDTRADLDQLATRYGSDKWGGMHWYTPHYARHFERLRAEPVRMLEIGIGGYTDPASGGASLRMWQRYFRRGLVYGLDIVDKTAVESLRVRTIQGDQGDPDSLRDIAALGPLDIVVDDGSHRSEDVIASFTHLFPAVRPGGYYVIEDLHTSYWPTFGGDTDLTSPRTTVGFLKTLLDGLHHEEHRPQPSYTDRHVTGVFFYNNIVFIEKGHNQEGGVRMKHIGIPTGRRDGQ